MVVLGVSLLIKIIGYIEIPGNITINILLKSLCVLLTYTYTMYECVNNIRFIV